MRVLHYHDSMAQSPKMMKAIVARIAIGLAARMRLARSPDVDACHHAKNTPPVSQILAHHEHQSCLEVGQFVRRQLLLQIVVAAHRLAPTTCWPPARRGQRPHRLRCSSCAGLPALAATCPISVATGPAPSGGLSGLSCYSGRVDRPRLRGRTFTRAVWSRAGRLRRQACRGALHAPRRCVRRRALAASLRLRLPLLFALSNSFLEAAPAAALPRGEPAFRPLRPRSTIELLRRHRRWARTGIDLRLRQLLVQVHDKLTA